MSTAPAQAVVISRGVDDGVTQVTVICPYCRLRHVHGVPHDGLVDGEHRTEHCGRGDGAGYLLVEEAPQL